MKKQYEGLIVEVVMFNTAMDAILALSDNVNDDKGSIGGIFDNIFGSDSPVDNNP